MAQSSALIAFHGNPDIKARCIARIEADLAANQQNLDACLDAWWNSAELGIPKWLCRTAKNLGSWCRTWSRDFLQAVPVGFDLDAIKAPFLIFVLGCARGAVQAHQTEVLAAVDRSIFLWKAPDIGSDRWLDYASAAEAAASEAASAVSTGAAKSRPSYHAALAAASAAQAAGRTNEWTYEYAVIGVMNHTLQALGRAHEAAIVASGYHESDFSDELLRLMKTSREWQHT